MLTDLEKMRFTDFRHNVDYQTACRMQINAVCTVQNNCDSETG